MDGQFSIERVFETLAPHMLVEVRWYHSPFFSKGFLRRLGNVLHVISLPNSVIHIIGDVTYLALLLPGRRLIITFHDVGIYSRKRGLQRWLIGMFWYRLPLRRAATVTAISHQTKKDLAQWFGIAESKIEVIPNPLPSSFDGSLKDKKSAREGVKNILQIGTKENKNLSRVFEAVNLAAAEHSICLTVVGEISPEFLSHRTYSFKLVNPTNVTNDDIMNLYAQADIVVFASTFEGFGLPILEAQAMGRPVVTSDIEPMRTVAGDGAILVNPYSVGEIAAAIDKLLRDETLVDALVTAGYSNVALYSPEAIAERYCSLYHRIM